MIVLTHAYGNRKGIRYMKNGLKIYHLPTLIVYDQVTLPTVYGLFHWMRSIWIREDIDIVHGHQV